jgi:hypothetical protein
MDGLTNPLLPAIYAGLDKHYQNFQQDPDIVPIAKAATHQGLLTGGIPQALQAATAQPGASTPPLGGIGTAPAAAPVRPMAGPSPQAHAIAPRDTPEMEEAKAELGRVTAPPLGRNDPMAHTRADTGLPGTGQIHNPWARIPLQILDAVGSGLFPNISMFIPGTAAHHALEAHQAQRRLGGLEQTAGEETKRAQEAALTEHTQAQTGAIPAETELKGAQTREADARAAALLHPEAKTEFEAWQRQNQNGTVADWLKLKSQNAPGHNETVFDVWRKQNPDAPAEDWLKIEAANKPEAHNEYADYKAGYIKAHPEATAEEIVKNYAKAHQAPEHAPQAMMLGEPDETGNRTAQLVRPGTVVGPHAVTPSGASGEQVAADKADAAAKKARVDAQSEYQLVKNLAATPSPTNDLAIVMRYIGATKPDSLGKLRLNQNEIKLVYGTRSTFGDIEALLQKVQNGQSLTPKQRQEMLGTMKILAQGGAETTAGGGTIPYSSKGKTYNIPAAEEADFLKDHPEAKRAGGR